MYRASVRGVQGMQLHPPGVPALSQFVNENTNPQIRANRLSIWRRGAERAFWQ